MFQRAGCSSKADHRIAHNGRRKIILQQKFISWKFVLKLEQELHSRLDPKKNLVFLGKTAKNRPRKCIDVIQIERPDRARCQRVRFFSFSRSEKEKKRRESAPISREIGSGDRCACSIIERPSTPCAFLSFLFFVFFSRTKKRGKEPEKETKKTNKKSCSSFLRAHTYEPIRSDGF